MNEGTKVSAAINRLWKVRSLNVSVKRLMYGRIVVPTELYGADTWNLNSREKNEGIFKVYNYIFSRI